MLLYTNGFLNKKSFALRKLKLKKSEFDDFFRIYSIYSTVGRPTCIFTYATQHRQIYELLFIAYFFKIFIYVFIL